MTHRHAMQAEPMQEWSRANVPPDIDLLSPGFANGHHFVFASSSVMLTGCSP
jgi:hypothetical protein